MKEAVVGEASGKLVALALKKIARANVGNGLTATEHRYNRSGRILRSRNSGRRIIRNVI